MMTITRSIPNKAGLFLKFVFRHDPDNHMIRLFRIVRNRDGHPTPTRAISWKFSLAICWTLFRWRREYDGWILRIAGLRLHFCRSWGGRMV